MKQELVALSDHSWQRLRQRVDGLTDAEYLWEPAPGAWSIRTRDDGTRRHDFSFPPPDPIPVTTIAWRLWHLIDLYGEDRAPTFLAVAPQGDAIGLDDPTGGEPPATAAAAIDLLERAHDRWDAHLALVTDSTLSGEIGPVGGGYATSTRAAFVLHMLDEYIHHGAEIGVLRDLYRWQQPLMTDDLRERVVRGDRTVIDELPATDSPENHQGNRTESTDLIALAARYGRWDLVVDLLRAGAPIDNEGTTALHRAAAADERTVIGHLVDHGADPSAKDPDRDATPEEWARYMGHDRVADRLAGHRRDQGPRSSE